MYATRGIARRRESPIAGTASTTNIIWGDALGHSTGETPHGVLRFQTPQFCD